MFQFLARVVTFLFTTISRRPVGSTQPSEQWVPKAVSPVAEQPVCEADHSPFSAEVNNV